MCLYVIIVLPFQTSRWVNLNKYECIENLLKIDCSISIRAGYKCNIGPHQIAYNFCNNTK